jgi:hypothetical protein
MFEFKVGEKVERTSKPGVVGTVIRPHGRMGAASPPHPRELRIQSPGQTTRGHPPRPGTPGTRREGR